MNVLFYSAGGDRPAEWEAALRAHLPELVFRVWTPDAAPFAADYVLAWQPPAALFAGQTRLRAVFNLGAGVDAVLAADTLPAHVPLIRLEDAGMGQQMLEYVAHAVLRRYRRFDVYEEQARRREWCPHALVARPTLGVLGLGVLGRAVARGMHALGFTVRGWSRSAQTLDGIACYAGAAELDTFLAGSQVLVCLLPLTADTAGILGRDTFARLPRGAYLINLARGGHLVENDLLEALATGQLAGACLDVFAREPLPPQHAFWTHPRISVTPHVSALTLLPDAARQIAAKLRALEAGEAVSGVVDRARGY